MTLGIEDVRRFYDGWVDYLAVERSRHRKVYSLLDAYVPHDCTVLDIGCGTGLTSKHLALGNRRVTAVDLSPILIDYAKSHNDGCGIEYISADITTWGDQRKFDYISMTDIVEHILPETVPMLMSVLDRLSHPNTGLFLHIPSPGWVGFWFDIHPEKKQVVETYWSMGEVENKFATAGFVPILFDGTDACYHTYVMVKEEKFEITYREMVGG